MVTGCWSDRYDVGGGGVDGDGAARVMHLGTPCAPDGTTPVRGSGVGGSVMQVTIGPGLVVAGGGVVVAGAVVVTTGATVATTAVPCGTGAAAEVVNAGAVVAGGVVVAGTCVTGAVAAGATPAGDA